MLTRLKVSGFKNLVDVDLRFGPFTCIAGANGTGKSNLFDTIRFLSALADSTLMEAALSVRSEGENAGDVRSLFHRAGDRYDPEMSFEVEMIVPRTGVDDLGQEATATITFLRYSLSLAYREGQSANGVGGFRADGLEITKEDLVHINKGDAHNHLLFPHMASVWRDSVVAGRRDNRAPFISTDHDSGGRPVIRRHQDGGSSGKPISRLAANLPRTVLSVSNAAESPTALVARREMQSWRLLQLEPSALRRPDPFNAPTRLGSDGSHLAATLYRLAYSSGDPDQMYGRVADRLSRLLDDVRNVSVDRDDKRELLTLQVEDFHNTSYSARALSDGTLRFLALAVLERDPEEQGLLCLEEPENGIHPQRIEAMLELLQSIATDVKYQVGDDNPLRQVVINTHSPAVVQQVPDASLVVAKLRNTARDGQRFKRAVFGCLPKTWRTRAPEVQEVSKGELLTYLNPVPRIREDKTPTRVMDREDLQEMLSGFRGS